MSIIKYKKIDQRIPDLKYAYHMDTGYDIRAYTPNENIRMNPMDIKRIRTGIHLNIPLGIDTQIRTKSGLAEQAGIIVLNSPATIDAGYTGEINVLLINLGKRPIQIKNGDRIAQLCFNKRKTTELKLVSEINEETEQSNKITEDTTIEDPKIRGNKGFGSSGID